MIISWRWHKYKQPADILYVVTAVQRGDSGSVSSRRCRPGHCGQSPTQRPRTWKGRRLQTARFPSICLIKCLQYFYSRQTVELSVSRVGLLEQTHARFISRRICFVVPRRVCLNYVKCNAQPPVSVRFVWWNYYYLN